MKILNFAMKYDLVTIQTSFAATPPVLLADSETAAAGQDIIVLGSPQGLEGTVSTGIIGGLRTIGGVRYLQITPISPAAAEARSSIPHGRVIGLFLTATSAKGQNLNFALPANLPRRPARRDRVRRGEATPFDLRDGDRLKDLVYFNILEEFGFFAEGSTLMHGVAPEPDRSGCPRPGGGEEPRGEVLDFHLRDFKGTRMPIFAGGHSHLDPRVQDVGHGIETTDRGSYEIRLLDYKVCS